MNTSKKTSLRCAAVLSAVALFSTLSAVESKALPNSPVLTKRDNASLSHSDRSFLEKAAKAGAKEIQVSQVIVGRVNDPQIKAFAQMVIADHMAANTELLSLAARKGETFPIDDLKAAEKWSKKSKDLDEDYVKEMKEDHEDAVKLFEKGAKSDDAEIAEFARKTLTALEHHLAMLQELKQKVH